MSQASYSTIKADQKGRIAILTINRPDALNALNTQVVTISDFVLSPGGCALTPAGRKRFIEAYERRVEQLVSHPIFGYRISYRRVFEVQARLLARCMSGELDAYPAFRTR